MRAVAQRVRSARITSRPAGSQVARELVGEMGVGLLCLVAVAPDDEQAQADALAQKLVHLRVFADEEGRMNRSLLDVGGTLGVVSQFTLFGDVRQGRRPSYAAAAPAEQAKSLVEAVTQAARDLGVPVVTGRFQAMMDVSLVNDGPVTILLDTDKAF